MGKLTVALAGFAAGVLAALLMDPSQGRSRRAGRVTHRQLRRVESEAYGVTQKVQHLRPEDEHPSEQRLLARVRSEVFRDPSVPKGQLNVSVDERGTVVLRGHTSDEATRRAIEHRTRSVAGVEHVENLINVAP